MMRVTVVLILLMLISACGDAAVNPDDPELGHIVIDVQEDRASILSAFVSTEPLLGDTLSYSIEVVRDGASGTAVNSQSGSLSPQTTSLDTLSIININVGEGDYLDATLDIYQEDDLIDQTELTQEVY